MTNQPPIPVPRRGSFAAAMRALGHRELPERIVIDGVTHERIQVVKHDFFAATGFYQDAMGRRAVLKIGRTTEFLGVPLLWLGRYLCRRELRFYHACRDLPNVPQILSTYGQTGFVHHYVDGQPLSKHAQIPDTFFDELHALFLTLYERGIAYVDTNKPENILIGSDGRPHLIDFQISFGLHDWGDNRITRWLLNHFHKADIYHLFKHKRRLRPDQLRPGEAELGERRGLLIDLHRLITKPYFLLRRQTMKRLKRSGHIVHAGSN